MSDQIGEAAEFLRGLADTDGLPPQDADHLRRVANWATPERLGIILGIARQVTDRVLGDGTGWHEVPDAEAPQVVAQPGFVLLREYGTGRQSAPEGEPIHVPQEMVVHLARLLVLLATGHATPVILDSLRLLAEAEERTPSPFEDEAALRRHVAEMTAYLDHLMLVELGKDDDLTNYVTAVLLFLMTDDPDEALRLDLPS